MWTLDPNDPSRRTGSAANVVFPGRGNRWDRRFEERGWNKPWWWDDARTSGTDRAGWFADEVVREMIVEAQGSDAAAGLGGSEPQWVQDEREAFAATPFPGLTDAMPYTPDPLFPVLPSDPTVDYDPTEPHGPPTPFEPPAGTPLIDPHWGLRRASELARESVAPSFGDILSAPSTSNVLDWTLWGWDLGLDLKGSAEKTFEGLTGGK